jgi:APA family basic amino acid/polyamine antiporter
VLFVYQTTATWPGLLIVLTGVPVYFIWKKMSRADELVAEEAADELPAP